MNISDFALGGFQQAAQQLDSIAGKIARLPLVAEASREDTTDLGAVMVGLIEAQRTAEANLLVLHSADEINRSTLDVFG